MSKFLYLSLLSGVVFFCAAADSTVEKTEETVEEVVVFGSAGDGDAPENVIEIDVDDATAQRMKDALAKGNVFEEDGVIVVENSEKSPVVQIDDDGNEIEDSFVILPEKSSGKERIFKRSTRAVLSDGISKPALDKMLSRIERAAAEVFYFALPYMAKAGAVLEDVSDELARKFLGMNSKSKQERAELYKRYEPYVNAGEKSKLRRMMVEFTEVIEDESESVETRQRRNLARRKNSSWKDDFANLYADTLNTVVVNVESKVVYTRHRSWFPRKYLKHRVPVGKRHNFRHHKKHRIHYLPPRYSGKKQQLGKPIVFRNHKAKNMAAKKYSSHVPKTAIKMRHHPHKKHQMRGKPLKRHPVRRR